MGKKPSKKEEQANGRYLDPVQGDFVCKEPSPMVPSGPEPLGGKAWVPAPTTQPINTQGETVTQQDTHT